ncbi:MAG: MFS transporter [Bacteroidota bacterium]
MPRDRIGGYEADAHCWDLLIWNGTGTNSPTLLAWATDLSDPHHRGRGLASLYIFMEMGIGVGAFFSGIIFVKYPLQFIIPFVVSCVLCLMAFLYLWTAPSRKAAVI